LINLDGTCRFFQPGGIDKKTPCFIKPTALRWSASLEQLNSLGIAAIEMPDADAPTKLPGPLWATAVQVHAGSRCLGTDAVASMWCGKRASWTCETQRMTADRGFGPDGHPGRPTIAVLRVVHLPRQKCRLRGRHRLDHAATKLVTAHK
jgi:hypothetical protein